MPVRPANADAALGKQGVGYAKSRAQCQAHRFKSLECDLTRPAPACLQVVSVFAGGLDFSAPVRKFFYDPLGSGKNFVQAVVSLTGKRRCCHCKGTTYRICSDGFSCLASEP